MEITFRHKNKSTTFRFGADKRKVKIIEELRSELKEARNKIQKLDIKIEILKDDNLDLQKENTKLKKKVGIRNGKTQNKERN